MNTFLPNNIFTRILVSCFPDEIKSKVSFLPSAQITQSIEKDNSSVGLIPVMDLIKHKDVVVSGQYGISFEGSLCNSYIYYSKEERTFSSLSLAGDISAQDVILSKILFKEIYGTDIEIGITADLEKAAKNNILIIGDDNFIKNRFRQGISFSEIMVDTMSFPFVNYVFASANKDTLGNFIKNLNGIENLFYNKIEEENIIVPSFEIDTEGADYIKSNISSVVLGFDEQDREGINQMLRLPYFHGMVNDIVEVKFI